MTMGIQRWGLALLLLVPGIFGTKSAAAEPPSLPSSRQLDSALRAGATIYLANAATALRADRDCHGARCRERYFSLLPVIGGALQLSHAGANFHDHHHGQLCLPLTVAAVGAQSAAIVAYITGAELSWHGPLGGQLELSIVPFEDDGMGSGLGVAWVY